MLATEELRQITAIIGNALFLPPQLVLLAYFVSIFFKNQKEDVSAYAPVLLP